MSTSVSTDETIVYNKHGGEGRDVIETSLVRRTVPTVARSVTRVARPDNSSLVTSSSLTGGGQKYIVRQSSYGFMSPEHEITECLK